MGSKRFGGVRFQCYSHDHLPPHVHAFYAGCEVILELLADGTVQVGGREHFVIPINSPLAARRQIRRVAVERYTELLALWETIHGTAF